MVRHCPVSFCSQLPQIPSVTLHQATSLRTIERPKKCVFNGDKAHVAQKRSCLSYTRASFSNMYFSRKVDPIRLHSNKNHTKNLKLYGLGYKLGLWALQRPFSFESHKNEIILSCRPNWRKNKLSRGSLQKPDKPWHYAKTIINLNQCKYELRIKTLVSPDSMEKRAQNKNVVSPDSTQIELSLSSGLCRCKNEASLDLVQKQAKTLLSATTG